MSDAMLTVDGDWSVSSTCGISSVTIPTGSCHEIPHSGGILGGGVIGLAAVHQYGLCSAGMLQGLQKGQGVRK